MIRSAPSAKSRRAAPTGPVPGARRQARIALQLVARAEQVDRYAIAGAGKHAGRDEAVAAIVAGPAEHGDPGAERNHPARGRGDRFPGALHQEIAAGAGGDGPAVGLAHLLRREQLDDLVADGAILGRPLAHQRGETRRPLLAD